MVFQKTFMKLCKIERLILKINEISLADSIPGVDGNFSVLDIVALYKVVDVISYGKVN